MATRTWIPVLSAALALTLAACQSQPPYEPVPVPPAGTGRFATRAICTPDEGPAFDALEVVGAPDGQGLEMSRCVALDIFFGGGTLKTLVGFPDLAVHLADETPFTCPEDCGSCGNGICELQESFLGCRADCLPRCGDGTCDDLCGNQPDDRCDPSQNESCFSCPEDCGSCRCGDQPCLPGCGDGSCDVAAGENCLSCPVDCGPACLGSCGNGSCDRGSDEPLQSETCLNCPQDCGPCRVPSCGDQTCDEAAGLVETSHTGQDYQVVGFINFKPQQTPASCAALIDRNWALVFFDRCNTVSNVIHLRVNTLKGSARNATIDAIEALSFEPKNEQ